MFDQVGTNYTNIKFTCFDKEGGGVKEHWLPEEE